MDTPIAQEYYVKFFGHFNCIIADSYKEAIKFDQGTLKERERSFARNCKIHIFSRDSIFHFVRYGYFPKGWFFMKGSTDPNHFSNYHYGKVVYWFNFDNKKNPELRILTDYEVTALEFSLI